MFDEISRLKGVARRNYLAYKDLLDSVDCGSEMLELLKPEAYKCRMNFNAAMDRLSQLDPNCPTKRL